MPRNKRLIEIKQAKERLRNLYKRTTLFIKKKPFTSFLVGLGFLFLAILANSLTAPKAMEITKKEAPKEVDVYRIGKPAKTSVLAQVEKAGVVTIVAQTPGIVSNIYVNEGDTVWQGKTLITLSNNYAGGNASSISKELAALQYQNALDTYDQQINLIDKQKEIAQKADGNSDGLRSITDQSLSETRSVIDLNNNILSAIDASLAASDDLSLKQLKSQFLTGNNLLKSGLRNAEFQVAGDKPQAQLSDLQKDVTLGQLDIQLKALDLSLEVSRLQLALVEVSESVMNPSAPYGAIVERVYVYPGQTVNPGTPLVKLAGFKQEVNLVAKVPSVLARRVSNLSDSTIHIDDKEFMAKPDFISHEATDGELYTILFAIPEGYSGMLTNGEYIQIDLSIGVPDTGGAMPFVPIDSVFQTQDNAFVYVVDKDKAKSKNVSLGQVIGGEVEVKGLAEEDMIILNRNILSGDRIVIKN